uniref:Major facilitator superfamily (MFS) profile domain-containing protein n=1 Tax=Branchiostoma floridae TaxID=7739 RepID=C3Y3D1_BRAFL|eukprot:XP_002609188.1 hypothetical protein BRAFLDRAFT_90639 [Branchiostoma floridae]
MSFVIYCTVYLAELWKMGTTEKDVTPSDAGGKTETKSERDSEKGSCCLLADKIPARYVLAALFFVGHISMTISRGGFALAVVVMVNSSSRVTPVNQTNTYQLCPSSGPGNASTQNDQGELDWSESIKGVILGAFFYGYIFTQVVGGLLEQKFGCKIVYGTSTLLGTVLSVLSPVASRTSPWAIFAVRFCMGLVSGVLFPCLYGIWGRWAPPTERTKLLAICYIGLPLGNIINYPLSSFLAAQLGWEYIFYIPEQWKMDAMGKDMTSSDAGGKTETKSERDSEKGSCCLLADRVPARYVLAVLFFFGHIAMMTFRSGFSIAIVVMVNSSSPVNQTNTYLLCPSSGSGNTSAQNNQGELDWSESIKGVLLGAYFYGYIVTQVLGGLLEQKFGGKIVYGTSMLVTAALNALGPVASRTSPWAMFAVRFSMGLVSVLGGLLEQRFGGKIVYGTSMLVTAALNALGPVASRTSPWAMFAVRFSMGLVSGVLFPTLYGVWSRWAPLTERTSLLAICYIGIPLGNIINYPLASYLADELGWEYIFYVPGGLVAAWFVAWLLLAYDSPAKHPRILEEEQKYIEDSTGMRERQNGLLSALPFVLSMVTMLTSSVAADRLIQGGKIPKVWIRRGFVIIGFSGTVICGVILANLTGCNPAVAVSLLCITEGFNGMTVAGFRAVHVEFAPRFSGVTFALANVAATVAGIFAPLLVGFITDNDNEEGELEWSKSLRGTLLGAYYYGYIITQVVGGVLEQKLGGKIVYGTGILAIAALDALGPVASRTRFSGTVICGVILANLSGCNPAVAVALLCITEGFNGMTVAGFRAVHVEFAPRFSGVTFALANIGATVAGIFAPLLVGFITDNDNTELAGSTDLIIANEHVETPAKVVEMPNTKL